MPDSTAPVERVNKFWTMLVGIFVAGAMLYGVVKNDIPEHTQRITSLEAAAGENREDHREITVTTRNTQERLDGIQRQLSRQNESLDRISLTLERVCAKTNCSTGR